MSDLGAEFYRKDAIKHYLSGYQDQKDVLRVTPKWMNWTYLLLISAFFTGVCYLLLGTINEYAAGPAIIRVEGRLEITAISAGTITAIAVQPGQHVIANQLLVSFYNKEEVETLARIKQQLEAQLLKALKTPTDQSVLQAIIALRSQKELAEVKLKERSLRASQAGIVRDIRIREGQLIAPGETLLSLLKQDYRLSTNILLPGYYRPLLKLGLVLKLQPIGYSQVSQELTIAAIGDEVIGPNEAKRFLGPELGDTIAFSGPVVLVKAYCTSSEFVSEGRKFSYYDGMQAVAKVRVRSEPILFSLFPELRETLQTIYE